VSFTIDLFVVNKKKCRRLVHLESRAKSESESGEERRGNTTEIPVLIALTSDEILRVGDGGHDQQGEEAH
jgi:hypothetical protein